MTHITKMRGILVSALVVGGLVAVTAAQAAPIYTVTYKGAKVSGAVPGKPVTVNFQVKNTSDQEYDGVKVVFHMPGDLTVTKVAPGAAVIDEHDIYWENVPIAPGKFFYPSFTVAIASGTPAKTKLNIWVEVTGTDMTSTSTNFSIIAASVKKAATSHSLSSAQVTTIFQSVYDRVPTASELKYWLGRRADKPAAASFTGAVAYHKALGIKH